MENTPTANLEAAGQAFPQSGVKLYVLVRVWDGCTDGASLHMTEQEADDAYQEYTGIKYGEYSPEKHGDQHWDATTIEEIKLRPEQEEAIVNAWSLRVETEGKKA